MRSAQVLAAEFEKAGKTVDQIAEASGLEARTIQSLLDGERFPKKKEEIAIRNALGLKRLNFWPETSAPVQVETRRPRYRREVPDYLPWWIHQDLNEAIKQSKLEAVPDVHAGLANYLRYVAQRIDHHVDWCHLEVWDASKGCYDVPAKKPNRVECLAHGLNPDSATCEELEVAKLRKKAAAQAAPACSVDLKISSNGKGGQP